jgi:hypothetical protein
MTDINIIYRSSVTQEGQEANKNGQNSNVSNNIPSRPQGRVSSREIVIT